MRKLLPAIALIGLLAWTSTALAISADYSRNPVLLVHGYFVINNAGDATWAHIRSRLVDDGWPIEYLSSPSFSDVRGCDPEHANTLSGWVDDLLAKTGFDKVDIICHSEGCLNSLYYMKYLCGVNKVRRIVMLAGAVHGTEVACVDFLSCGAKEMCVQLTQSWQDNPVLAALLAGDETPGDVLYTCVWAPGDEIIIPQTGSQLVGANNLKVQTPGVEHGGIFLCDECYGYVQDALLNGTGLNTDGPGWDSIPTCKPLPPEAEEVEVDDDLAAEADGTTADGPADADAVIAAETVAFDAVEGAVDVAVDADVAAGKDAVADEAVDAARPDQATVDAVTPDAPAVDDPAIETGTTTTSGSSGGCNAGAGAAPGAWLVAAALWFLRRQARSAA